MPPQPIQSWRWRVSKSILAAWCHQLLVRLWSALPHARELGINRLPLVGKLPHAIGLGTREVVLLGPILREIVQLPRPIVSGRDQFPIACANRAIVVVIEV